jgi:hypothetical protein
MQPKKTFALLGAIVATGSAVSAQSMVYNNGVNYSGFYLNPGANEVGDEIILAAGPRMASTFQFEYFASYPVVHVVNETFRIRFYANDGADLGGPFNTHLPNTVLYDSGSQILAPPIDPSGRATYLFDLTLANIVLPDRFTWSVQFSGLDAGETIGVSIYDPPTVGNNFDDYWYNTGATWELRATNGIPINFGAQITAVPEPSTYVLAILGGICGLALLNRQRNSRR